jgi:hypothetical protein
MKPGATVYVGPNNKLLGLSTYMRFPEGYPAHIAQALIENPGLATQFMPWSTFLRMPPPGHVPRQKISLTSRKHGPPIAGAKTFSNVRLK